MSTLSATHRANVKHNTNDVDVDHTDCIALIPRCLA